MPEPPAVIDAIIDKVFAHVPPPVTSEETEEKDRKGVDTDSRPPDTTMTTGHLEKSAPSSPDKVSLSRFHPLNPIDNMKTPWHEQKPVRSQPPGTFSPVMTNSQQHKTMEGFTPCVHSSTSLVEAEVTAKILPASDVLDTLTHAPCVNAIILDPWYNKGVGGERKDYDDWLSSVIYASCRLSDHVFVWGFPDILAAQVGRIPPGFSLLAWLTWFYKNCPSVIRGWRSAQNACLHIAAQDGKTYPEHFLTNDQRERWQSGKMRFIPGPPSVLEAPLNIGFVGRSEQTGHPAQKPLSVIEPLIRMATKEGDTVLDPMCGSGTTGEACLRLGRNVILSDISADYLTITQTRIAKWKIANAK